MSKFKSKLISGICPDESIIEKAIYGSEARGLKLETPIEWKIFEVTMDKKIFYCCLAGAYFGNDEPALTPLGQATFETLLALPFANDTPIGFREIVAGKTPLEHKVKTPFKVMPTESKICFAYDATADIESAFYEVLNVKGAINIGSILKKTIHSYQ